MEDVLLTLSGKDENSTNMEVLMVRKASHIYYCPYKENNFNVFRFLCFSNILKSIRIRNISYSKHFLLPINKSDIFEFTTQFFVSKMMLDFSKLVCKIVIILIISTCFIQENFNL